jgi:hypothetical protein
LNGHKIIIVNPNKYKKHLEHISDKIHNIISPLFNKDPLMIDTVNALILESYDPPDYFINLLSKFKIYFILELYRKTAQAILYGCKDGDTFKIKHHNSTLETHVYISGQPSVNDKGIAYVTLISDSIAYKTYLWRSADIKNFQVGDSRLITCLLPVISKLTISRLKEIMSLYGLLILENSWGNSLVLKPFRYLVSSYVYNSPMLIASENKWIKTLIKYKEMCNNKMSLNLLFELYKRYSDLNNKSKTPIFKLDPKDIGYEAFLMNLCPPDTYGKRRHRVNMSIELAEEIELSRKYENKVWDIRENFRFLIKQLDTIVNNRLLCMKLIKDHYKLIDSISDDTDGRFTLSPISLLLIYEELSKFARGNRVYQGSTPRVQSLMTTKSSFLSHSFNNGTAMESITEEMLRTGLSTTSLLAINSLSELPLDLTFRMFDKDQIGGDREISIMPAQFRILQSITENFSKILGKQTGVDMLDNKQKIKLITIAHNENLNALSGIEFTADQTRWGPNFNTSLFGYMMTLFLRHTTEAFIPMITCFLGEYKVFQMLSYPELSKYQEEGYTLPGMIGKFHMGQGIYHYTSSLYHSFTHMTISTIFSRYVNAIKGSIFYSRSFITSDDVAMISYLIRDPATDFREIEYYQSSIERLNNLPLFYEPILKYFCIKPSEYKNNYSRNNLEFNSIFWNENSVGSNSLKFLYSLVNPYSSGNERRDMDSCFDIYIDAINSNLTNNESFLLSLMVLKHSLLKWGYSNIDLITIIGIYIEQYKNNKYLPVLMTTKEYSQNDNEVIYSNTILPFKRYNRLYGVLNKAISIANNFELKSLLSLKRDTLSKSKSRRLGSNRGIVLSKKLRAKSRICAGIGNDLNCNKLTGLSYIAWKLIYENIGSLIGPSAYLNFPSEQLVDIQKGFSIDIIKRSEGEVITLEQALYSSYPAVNIINKGSSFLDILIHISRNNQILRVDTDNIEYMSFMERLYFFDEELSKDGITGNASRLIYNNKQQKSRCLTFPIAGGRIKYVPKMTLQRTTQDLHDSRSTRHMVYVFGKDFENKMVSAPSSGRRYVIQHVEEAEFIPDVEAIRQSAIQLIKTDSNYTGSSSLGSDKIVFMNIPIYRVKTDDGTSKISFSEDMIIDSVEITNEKLDAAFNRIMVLFEQQGLDIDNIIQESDDLDQTSESLELLLNRGTEQIEKIVLSLRVPGYMELIFSNWLLNHAKMNGILYSLVKHTFVQNKTDTQPAELLYSIIKGDRRHFSTKPITEYRLGRASLRYKVKLYGMFNMLSVIRRMSSLFSSPLKVKSRKDRLMNLLSTAMDINKLDISNIGIPLAGVTITKKPNGRVSEIDDIIVMLSK